MKLEVGTRVVINSPHNPRLHDTHASVKEVRTGYYLLNVPAAATGEFRALEHEVIVLRNAGILETNTTGTVYEAVRASGYTGDSCPNCQSIRMKRNGPCLLCENCGQTTGCS